jgi:membrane fusion protein (multidrug efflux system)
MHRVYQACFAVALAAVCLTGCKGGAEDKKAGKDAKDEALPVEVVAATRGGIEAVIHNSTHLQAEEEVKVYARTSNRVTELLAEEGQEVTKGQVLLRLDNDIQKTAYAKATSSLNKARQEFVRQKALYEQKLISEQMFQNTEHELKQLELALEDAQRGVEYTEVRAPIAGTISQRLVNYGDLVNVNQHLYDIVDFNSMVARIYVPEKNLPDLRPNQPARVTATPFAGKEFAGYVKRIAPIVESRTGTVKVTIGFKEIGPLRPGMYVDVDLVTSSKPDAILLTKRALLYDGELMYVFRLLPDRKVERVKVEPKISDKLNVEPTSGFQEGDQIVVAGQTGLKDGAKVRLPGDPLPEEKKDPKNQKGAQGLTAKSK